MVPVRRFTVSDELGKLRTFYTRAEAERFCHGNMFITETKPLTMVEHNKNLASLVGDALF